MSLILGEDTDFMVIHKENLTDGTTQVRQVSPNYWPMFDMSEIRPLTQKRH